MDKPDKKTKERCKQCGSHICDCKEEWLEKCECGNDTFFINEGITHEGSIDPETGTLNCYSIKANEIENVVCNKCGEEYQSNNFKEIEWNN